MGMQPLPYYTVRSPKLPEICPTIPIPEGWLGRVSVVWDYVIRIVLPINPGSQKIADAVIVDIVSNVDTSIGEIHSRQVKFMLDSSQRFPLNRPSARNIKDRRHCRCQRQICHRAFLPKVGS